MSTSKNKKLCDAAGAGNWRRDLGERIAHVRKRLGISQTVLAKRFGRANNTVVSRMEAGKSESLPFVAMKLLIELTEEANYTAEWLLTGDMMSRAISREELTRRLDEMDKDEVSAMSVGDIIAATRRAPAGASAAEIIADVAEAGRGKQGKGER